MLSYRNLFYGMVNGKDKKSGKKFLNRSALAKRLGIRNAGVDRLILRDVIEADAWVILTSSLEHPVFDVERVDEIRSAMDAYFRAIAAGRLEYAGK